MWKFKILFSYCIFTYCATNNCQFSQFTNMVNYGIIKTSRVAIIENKKQGENYEIYF